MHITNTQEKVMGIPKKQDASITDEETIRVKIGSGTYSKKKKVQIGVILAALAGLIIWAAYS